MDDECLGVKRTWMEAFVRGALQRHLARDVDVVSPGFGASLHQRERLVEERGACKVGYDAGALHNAVDAVGV
jgi:hypothetical protein